VQEQAQAGTMATGQALRISPSPYFFLFLSSTSASASEHPKIQQGPLIHQSISIIKSHKMHIKALLIASVALLSGMSLTRITHHCSDLSRLDFGRDDMF
jgi:hypothetical protein